MNEIQMVLCDFYPNLMAKCYSKRTTLPPQLIVWLVIALGEGGACGGERSG